MDQTGGGHYLIPRWSDAFLAQFRQAGNQTDKGAKWEHPITILIIGNKRYHHSRHFFRIARPDELGNEKMNLYYFPHWGFVPKGSDCSGFKNHGKLITK
jgi:hypothetical protein